MNLEKLIFENIIYNDDYNRKVIPFLKAEYFKDTKEQIIFGLLKSYFDKYNRFPTKESLLIDLKSISNLSTDDFKWCDSFIQDLAPKDKKDTPWLIDRTEQFCKDSALYNALHIAIAIVDEKNTKDNLSKGAIPTMLSDALGVSFDTKIGHDFLEDFPERFKYYHASYKKVAFDLNLFNKITDDGLIPKTLNIIMAGVGIGKSLAMCSMSAFNLMQGLNVLYITLELSEDEVGKRIDANLLDIPLNDLKLIQESVYNKKVEKLRESTKGKLVVKEYPTACAGANHFRFLINELKIKKNFKPDIIYIDYLNLCISSRLKMGANVGSYTYVQAIAQELRGLGVENEVPVVSATQVNREGFTDSDFGLEHTSESWGLPGIADLMIGFISTEELIQLNQILVKQLKNRYNDVNYFNKFVIGVDKAKMRLYNVENSAQDDILDSVHLQVTVNGQSTGKFDKSKFEDFLA